MKLRSVVVGEKIEVLPESLDKMARGKPSRIKFSRTSTNDIMAREFEPIKWVVPGYVSEGFLVLAGRHKLVT
jgi:hypothetical protein